MILEIIGLILVLILLGAIIFINFSPQFGAKTTGAGYERIKKSVRNLGPNSHDAGRSCSGTY